MKKITTILSALILFSCNNSSKNETPASATTDAGKSSASEMTGGATQATAPASSTAHKYEIKSGIVTYNVQMQVGGTVINSKQILYFDDYGAKECEEKYKTEGGKEILTDRSFVIDGFQYILSIQNNGGVKTKVRGQGVAAKFNLEEASTQNQFKKVEQETIAGKNCEAFSMATPSGNIKMYGWNHITLKNVLYNASMKMKTETVATSIKENAIIPTDKFEVPKDVRITEM